MPFVEDHTQLSIKSILLDTHASESSQASVRYVLGLAQRYGSTVSLADVTSAAAICQIAESRQADLLVIGADKLQLRNPDARPTIEEILRTAPCPVLIIGPEVTHREHAKLVLERIAYVTDFSTSSLDALPYTLALAQDNDAQLTLVHIAQETTTGPFHYGDSRRVAFRKRLESLIPARSGLLAESEFVVGNGGRMEGLVRVAVNLNASLIVVSARGTPAKTSAPMLWPIVGQVVWRAPCPALIVRADRLNLLGRRRHE
jgi:nucleotide-binding universal stress UspA family protein